MGAQLPLEADAQLAESRELGMRAFHYPAVLAQRLAFGLLFDLGCCRRRLQLLDLRGNGRQIGLDLVVEQAALLGIEALGLGSELHALEQRVLVG